MPDTFQRHMAAIDANAVTKSNIIGLRKIFNRLARQDARLSVGKNPKIEPGQAAALMNAIIEKTPKVVGDLHLTGLKVLRNRRYARRWTSYQTDVISNLDHFELVGFEQLEQNGGNTPIYRAVTRSGKSFTFINPSWQSGGDGPEVI